MDKNLRLRLVVRRNGLPEVRVLFNLSLANDPSIADLLDLVNDTIPLEDAYGEWGLDDYTVELHDKDGHAFECLHFQPVSSLLDKDDQVYIRPLLTVDLKKRRLSGRHQILSGGEHLIDGVPFGRPRLRVPSARPPVAMAPRKRRRLTFDDAAELDTSHHMDDCGEDTSGEYFEPGTRQDEDYDQQQLLLTQHGDLAPRRDRRRRVRFPASLEARVYPNKASADREDEGETDVDSEGDTGSGNDEDMLDPDPKELADELRELTADNDRYDRVEDRETYGKSLENFHSHYDENSDEPRVRHRDRTASSPSIGRPTRPKAGNKTHGDGLFPVHEDIVQATQPATQNQASLHDLALMDKITAVRFAFPRVSAQDCADILVKNDQNVSQAWHVLSRSSKPRQGLAETMVLSTQLELPRQIRIMSSSPELPAEALGEISRVDDEDEGESSSSDGTAENGAEDSSDESESDNDSPPEEVSSRPSARHDARHNADVARGRRAALSKQNDIARTAEYSLVVSTQAKAPSETTSKLHSGREFASESRIDTSDASDTSNEEEPAPRLENRRRSRSIIVHSPPSRKDENRTPGKSARRASSSSDSSGKSLDSSSTCNSSSDSSFESSSDSDSNSETAGQTPRMGKGQASQPARAAKTSLSQAPAMQTSTRTAVPPGQGQTRTQKRNQRRRLEIQRKRAAMAAASNSQSGSRGYQAVQNMSLAAKKDALLHLVGASSTTPPEAPQRVVARASLTPANTHVNSNMTSNETDVWRQKITYRAVECVQGGVELSEPPFPFVQRWDPQQHWDAQPGSQRRGKRKSRNGSYFHDDPSLQSAKKRLKSGQAELHNTEGYSHEEDTTTSLMNQEDITLDYDDVSFNPDEGPMPPEPRDEEHREDDLPSLPNDVSSLPRLQKGDLATGMIIAWKQLLCTEATGWQPQLSNFMTAKVDQVFDEEIFHVQLAKRDREVDKNEKKYDQETGQRIYGKFEVPDEDQDPEEEDEGGGFRELCFSAMTDARIVRQAVGRPREEAKEGVPEAGPATWDNDSEARAVHSACLEFEVGDTQQQPLPDRKSPSKYSTSNEQPVGLGHEADDSEGGPGSSTGFSEGIKADQAEASLQVEESFISDTHPENRGIYGDECLNAGAATRADEVYSSDERRVEISLLIKEGGFRPQVRSSIDQSGFLHLGSPSRQLEEEYASSILPSNHAGSSRSASPAAPPGYEAKDQPQQSKPSQAAADLDTDAFHSAPQTPRVHRTGPDAFEATAPATASQGQSRAGHDSGVIEYPRLNTSQGTQITDQNGRQFDPNLITHSDNLGIHPSEGSPIVNISGDETTSLDGSTRFDGKEREKTPTQRDFTDEAQDVKKTAADNTPCEPTRLGMVMSPPGSGSSTGSSSIFPDIEFLGSQPAKIAFKESLKEIKKEPHSSRPKSSDASFGASISPPPLSRIKQVPQSHSSIHQISAKPVLPARSTHGNRSSRDEHSDGAARQGSESGFTLPEGSQVVSLLTSSPDSSQDQRQGVADAEHDESELEPEYTEMYAEDDLDGDFNLPKTKRASHVPRSPIKKGTSVPANEDKHDFAGPNWVPGSQGPSRKASGRYGGRWSATGF